MKNLISKVKNFFSSLKKSNIQELNEVKKIDKRTEEIVHNLPHGSPFSTRFVVKFWLLGAVVVYLSYIVFQSLEIIYLMLASFILALGIESLIETFQRRHFRRGWAIFMSYFMVVIILLGGFLLILPFVLDQFADVMRYIIANMENVSKGIQQQGLYKFIEQTMRIPSYIKNYMLHVLGEEGVLLAVQSTISENISSIVSEGSLYAKNLGSFAVDIVSGFFSVIVQIGMVLTLSVLFSIEKENLIAFVGQLAGSHKEYAEIKLQGIYKKLGIWLRSQLVLCFFIFVSVYVALLLLSAFGMDIPNKFSLALISGFTEFIPYLGPILGSVPALLIAVMSHGVWGLIVVAGLFYFIQWMENNVLIPVLMNRMLGISPVVVFICVIIGGMVLGIVGILIAVPIAVILTMIFDGVVKK